MSPEIVPVHRIVSYSINCGRANRFCGGRMQSFGGRLLAPADCTTRYSTVDTVVSLQLADSMGTSTVRYQMLLLPSSSYASRYEYQLVPLSAVLVTVQYSTVWLQTSSTTHSSSDRYGTRNLIHRMSDLRQNSELFYEYS